MLWRELSLALKKGINSPHPSILITIFSRSLASLPFQLLCYFFLLFANRMSCQTGFSIDSMSMNIIRSSEQREIEKGKRESFVSTSKRN